MTRGDFGIVLVLIGIGSLASCGGAGAAKSRGDAGSGGGPRPTAYICQTTLHISANDSLLTDFDGYSRDSDGLETYTSGSSESVWGALIASPGYASNHALQVTGSPVERWLAAYAWFLSLDAGRLAVTCADATAFDGVSFWVRGSPGPAELELATPSTLTLLQGGVCTGSCRIHRQVQVSNEWTHVETKWSEFSLDSVDGVSPGQIVGLSLSLHPSPSDAGPVELMVDDLGFIPRTGSSVDIDAGTARASNGNADAGAAPSSAACPLTPPAPSSPCTPPWTPSTGTSNVFAHCSWGDDPRTADRAWAKCDGGSWQVTWQPWLPQPSALPADCPATPPPDKPACDLSTDRGICWYGGTSCLCTQCTLPSPTLGCTAAVPQPFWSCTPPPNGCPADIPQAGAACATEGLHCSNDCNLDIVCQGGVWEWLHGYCPI